VSQDHRELERDADQNRPAKFADDARDLQDDRRARRDDKADLEREKKYRARINVIRTQWGIARNDRSPVAMDRKRGMLVELVQLTRAEVAADKQDFREDAAEHRDDHRELREDRHH